MRIPCASLAEGPTAPPRMLLRLTFLLTSFGCCVLRVRSAPSLRACGQFHGCVRMQKDTISHGSQHSNRQFMLASGLLWCLRTQKRHRGCSVPGHFEYISLLVHQFIFMWKVIWYSWEPEVIQDLNLKGKG